MTTVVTENTPVVPAAATSEVVVQADADKKSEDSSIYRYIFIGILSVALLLLLYYAYCRFTENSITEPYTKNKEQERDDPVIDFNLRESIKRLQNMQRQIMKTISENSEI